MSYSPAHRTLFSSCRPDRCARSLRSLHARRKTDRTCAESSSTRHSSLGWTGDRHDGAGSSPTLRSMGGDPSTERFSSSQDDVGVSECSCPAASVHKGHSLSRTSSSVPQPSHLLSVEDKRFSLQAL